MSTGKNGIMSVSSDRKEQIIDITALVAERVASSNIKSGVCIVFVPHTTAGITINENADPDVKADILLGLGDMVSDKLHYAHLEGNSAAHIKTALVGNSVTVIVENGRLALGTWQGIYFCEFDGPRKRQIMVRMVGPAGEEK